MCTLASQSNLDRKLNTITSIIHVNDNNTKGKTLRGECEKGREKRGGEGKGKIEGEGGGRKMMEGIERRDPEIEKEGGITGQLEAGIEYFFLGWDNFT